MVEENRFNRRNFIKNVTCTGIGMAISPSILKASQNQENLYLHKIDTLKSNKSKRKLGSIEVSGIGLGCMSMVAGTYNPTPSREEVIAHIRKAVESGVTFFDTAEVYGPYTSEEVVGEALEPFKGQVTIATKFGWNIIDNQRVGRIATPDSIKKVVDGSLKRLRIEAIDLYYLHRIDPNVPIEDVAGAVKDLIVAGKVKHWGLSEVSPATLRKAHAELPVAALQSQYSMIERVVENQILETCEELGIGFVPWGPTARSFLTGRFNEYSRFDRLDRRSQLSFFSPEGLEKNMPFLRIVRKWSQQKDITMAQFALAWLLAQKPFIVPIPGTISQQHLSENLGALDVMFTPEELKHIRTEIENVSLHGVRTPDSVLVDQ